MASPTNSVLQSFLTQGFKPNNLKGVGAALFQEIKERSTDVDTVSGTVVTLASGLSTVSGTVVTLTSGLTALSGTVDTKADLSGATFTGAVVIDSTATVSGSFTASGAVNFVLEDYADDEAAALGGIAIGQLYRTATAVKVRVE
jgi:hypothetical protein